MEKRVRSSAAVRWSGTLLTAALTLALSGPGEASPGDVSREAPARPPAADAPAARATLPAPRGPQGRAQMATPTTTQRRAGGEDQDRERTWAAAAARATIPGGSYQPLYARDDGAAVRVARFRLDRRPVTRAEFRAFMAAQPRWRAGAVPPVLASPAYLDGWASEEEGSAPDDGLPATAVSWFAAKAYCRWAGGRLPSADEWEYAARADETRGDASRDPAFRARALELATTRPGGVPAAELGFVDVHGVRGLHAPLNEWVLDFNAVLVSDDSRGNGARDRSLYCASGASGARDPGDYAAFLRYGFRASLEGASALRNLGFRCAADGPEGKE